MIHPKFANKIASRYVQIYEKDGFDKAQLYLQQMVKGDTALQKHLVPIIVKAGNRSK
jgi:hypothetical protein